ncbi:hypothetical protein LCGC14_1062480 [marine sediment metagenome]|uniref:Methyltransferase type 11 domain-containing protein n=1 Tax=marine sediment metagenome TaxID=412755 RepID=A0A0F9MKP8_9ZZZZ
MREQPLPLWEDEGNRIRSFSFLPLSRRPREYEYFIQNLPKPPVNLFEIGCGRGEIGPPTRNHASQITKMLLYNGYNLHGVDLHDITWTHPNFTYTRGNFLAVELPDNYYDGGLAVQVISHIGMVYFTDQNEPYDENADYRVFQKVARLLKPGGIFVTCLPIHNEFTVEGYRSPEGVNLLPAKKGRISDRARINDTLKEARLTLEDIQIYEGWNPKLGDKTVNEMIEGKNYVALLKVKKPT